MDVVWDESGSRIAALVAWDGRRADFSYDSSGRLVGVTTFFSKEEFSSLVLQLYNLIENK